MTQQEFAWVAGLLDRASYDERTGQGLHVVLAELGQLCGWSAWTPDTTAWRSATTSRAYAPPTVPMTDR